MKYLVFVIFFLGLGGFAQVPQMYQNLPTYKPKPKIQHGTKGPKPGAPASNSAPPRTSFVVTEHHPPALVMLVRAGCNERLKPQELIDMARKGGLGKRAQTVNWGQVKEGQSVSLWIVAAAKKWERKVDLRAKNGKYEMERNRVKEDYQWYVEKLVSPKTFNACIQEKDLTQSTLWNMIFSALIRVEKKDRS